MSLAGHIGSLRRRCGVNEADSGGAPERLHWLVSILGALHATGGDPKSKPV
jgi:hypothetical protein